MLAVAGAVIKTAELLSIVTTLVNAGAEGYESAKKVSKIIADRQAEGKPVTVGDLQSVIADDDAAKKRLEDAIANA